LSGLDFFPKEPEAIRSLVDVLATRCAHVDHVTLVVDDCLGRLTQAPKPVELLEVIERTKPVTVRAALSECPHCGGIGWVSTRRVVTVAGVGTYATDFASRCVCRGLP